jgi:molybdate transport system substrate-binding protein
MWTQTKNSELKKERLKYNQMKNRIIRTITTLTVTAAILAMTGCGSAQTSSDNQASTESTAAESTAASAEAVKEPESKEPVELTVLAAASLTDVCDEIKEMYEKEHDNVTLTFSYGGSGALQTQIEEGVPCDVFISAATKQMTALDEEGLMNSDTIRNLLENKVVLIVPKDSDSEITSFEDAATDKVSMIGLGEPGSVPVGQYSEEIFTTLGILDTVQAKANYGSDVRTVLSWVETSAVDCGVVYATDAYVSDGVTIVCEAPEGSCKKVIYPAGIVAASENQDEAENFIQYLESDEIMQLFESYGFSDATEN